MAYEIKGQWYVSVRINGKPIRHALKGCTTAAYGSATQARKMCEMQEAKMKREAFEGRCFDIKRNEQITLKEFSELYITSHSKVNKMSWEADVIRLRKINEALGHMMLGEITPIDIEKFKMARMNENSSSNPGQKLSPTAVNHDLKLLSSMYSKAVEWKKLTTENPMKSVKKLREKNKRLRFLSVEEIMSLYAACSDPDLLSLIKVAIHTGMRRGELLNLSWPDINWKNSVVSIYESKSGQARQIPLNEVAAKTLMAVPKRRETSKVFACAHRVAYKKALKAAGIQGATFHSLRHTFASHFIMGGGNLFTLSVLLGHSDTEMTKRYAHLSQHFMAESMKTLAHKLAEHKVSTNLEMTEIENLQHA